MHASEPNTPFESYVHGDRRETHLTGNVPGQDAMAYEASDMREAWFGT